MKFVANYNIWLKCYISFCYMFSKHTYDLEKNDTLKIEKKLGCV